MAKPQFSEFVEKRYHINKYPNEKRAKEQNRNREDEKRRKQLRKDETMNGQKGGFCEVSAANIIKI